MVIQLSFFDGASQDQNQKTSFQWDKDLPEKDVALMKDIFDAYRKRREANRHEPTSIDGDVSVMNNFINYSNKSLWYCTEEDFEAWSAHIGCERKLAFSTQRHYQNAVKGLFRYVVDNQVFPFEIRQLSGVGIRQICTSDNCVPHIHDRELKKERPAFSYAEINEFFLSLDAAAREAKLFSSKDLYPLMRDKVMFFLTYATGCRMSEVIAMNVSSFKPSPMIPAMGNYGLVTVWRKGSRGSGKSIQDVPVILPSIPALMDWYLTRVRPKFLSTSDANQPALFLSERGGRIKPSTFGYRFHHALVLAGFENRGFVPHCLRHTSVSHESLNMSVEATRIMHGHKHASTTQGYTHIPDPYISMELRDVHKSYTENLTKEK